MSSIYELANSPDVSNSVDKPSATRRYRVEDVSDELTVLSLATAYSPTTYLNLIREAVTLKPIEQSGGTIWDIEVPYVRFARAPLQVGEHRFVGKTTGGTRKMTQSLSTHRVHSSSGILLPGVVDFGSLIGVTSDGVEGVDIVSPVFEWTEEWPFAPGSVITAYLTALFTLTGTVNNAYFRGFNAGEVLFMGADFSKRTAEQWNFVFNFKAQPNISNATYGAFTNVEKDGWQYAWTWDIPTLNTSEQVMLRQPRYLIIENVYHYRNFAALGIGTASLLA